MEKGKEKHLKKGKRHPDQREKFSNACFVRIGSRQKDLKHLFQVFFLKDDPRDVW